MGPELANADGTTQCDAALSLAEETVTLEVQDPEGVIRSDEVTLEVIPSGPPEGTIVTPEPLGRYYSDVPITFKAQVADAEADPEDLRVYWVSDLDGSLTLASSPSTDGILEDATYLTEGQHQITMTVEDPQGNDSSDAVNIEVGGPNRCHRARSWPQKIQALRAGVSGFAKGIRFDPDVPANELFAEWNPNIDGVLGSDSPTSDGEVAYGTEDLSGGVHTITLSVTDETGPCAQTLFCTPLVNHPSSSQTQASMRSSALTTPLPFRLRSQTQKTPAHSYRWNGSVISMAVLPAAMQTLPVWH